jgi:hypothetical protein
MFDDTQQNTPPTPPSGFSPGRPLQPFGAQAYQPPPPPSAISPERTPTVPPPTVPSSPASFDPQGGKKGKKRTLLYIALAVVLIGGGAAVAALVFPKATETNTNANTNVVANTNTKNVNRVTNTNKANANTNATRNTNLNTNTALPNANTNTSVNAPVNLNTNASNTNASLNTNSALNANVVANTNTQTNTNVNATTNTNTQPATFALDTDGDKLNDYLESWVGTSKTNADSDGDGFPDGSEVTNKYSPLGSGAMTAAGLQSFCSRSTIIVQYGLSSTDVSTLCGIASDILTNIQVMAANTAFFEDLETQRSTSCSSFGKIDASVCNALITFIILDYLVSGS